MTPAAVEALIGTGYLTESATPSEGLVLPNSAEREDPDAARLEQVFSTDAHGLAADAVFRVGSSPVIIFKSAPEESDEEPRWHRLAWNYGTAPLLWVTTPEYIRLYNAFQPPQEYSGSSPVLKEFSKAPHENQTRFDEIDIIAAVAAVCSRQQVSMGSFWKSDLARKIDRRSRVDNVLIRELTNVLRNLVGNGLRTTLAQKLVGRCVLFQYLVHRNYVSEHEMNDRFGAPHLHEILTDIDHTFRVFRWIRSTFKGDLFPLEDEDSERKQLSNDARKLAPLSDFFGKFESSGQGRIFPFRFDAIPVELISSIYEKFVHMSETDGSPRHGVHYTPINLVDLVLDPVFENLAATARVLDPACGSGVFLVESLRRLVWLRQQTQQLSTDVVHDILLHQICGVDRSEAALSVATFSLYLALLELDPTPPRDLSALERVDFQPLHNRVLFATSAFNPELAERIAASARDGCHKFDVIIGNPPWTYSSKEKTTDRVLAREHIHPKSTVDGDYEHSAPDEEVRVLRHYDENEQRSGTTYARLTGRPLPPRSPDWAFLWRCLDFSHQETRVALIMKASPFFSLNTSTRAARDLVFEEFDNVAIVNLSQLRTSRLFQEYDDFENSGDKPRPNAGPALLFLSNCFPVENGAITTINFHWNAEFKRTGVFELPAEPPVVLRYGSLREIPSLLKVAMFGTNRDLSFVERLRQNPDLIGLKEWWDNLKIPAGQGFRAGSGKSAGNLKGLPVVGADNLVNGRIVGDLDEFSADQADRPRDKEIFQGPLVLMPEGGLTSAPIYGRYTAAYDERSLAYNESFFGLSFHSHSHVLAQALFAVMHSSLVAYQIGLGSGTVGIKQTKIEAVDLENVRIPLLNALPGAQVEALATAGELVKSERQGDRERAITEIDEIVMNAAALHRADRALLSDVERRAGSILFETLRARWFMTAKPTSNEILQYCQNLCMIFNSLALDEGDLKLYAESYTFIGSDLVLVRFTLTDRAVPATDELPMVRLAHLDPGVIDQLGGPRLPYLRGSTSTRLYVGTSVYMIKPRQYRYFSPAAGQSDGDRVVADVMYSQEPSSHSR